MWFRVTIELVRPAKSRIRKVAASKIGPFDALKEQHLVDHAVRTKMRELLGQGRPAPERQPDRPADGEKTVANPFGVEGDRVE